MNPTAIFFGLFYGIVSAVVFYVVSMLTSGLFARPFYRLYARVLIGICCVMMLAPPLRWLASLSPSWGFVGLTLAQYLAVGILMWGVFRFNRDFMQQIFLKRATVAYFTFGTLANALLVTLAFLQVAVSGAPTWGVLNGDRAYLTLGHYGPILLLLAAMVLHTDYRLKVCKGTPLHFSRFSFVGYALSFLGIALSMLPYLGQAITVLGLSTGEWQLLQNASCAQSLLIAIVVFAWLVWRYESIPPLFVLLLAIVFEYHVVFTQWAIRWWGVESWGLATLPLLFAMAGLYRYFSHWDERKRRSRNEGQSDQGTSRVQEESLRFVLPFQVVYGLLGIGLLSITLWARLAPGQLTSPLWAGATFGIYAIYFYGEAFFRRDVKLIYAAGLLAILAALLGFERPGFAESVITLGFLAFAWGMIALAGERLGLKRAWRTAMIDGSFVAAFMVVGLVFLRHLGTNQPYYFAAVSWQDGLACLCAAGAFAACAHQYRSRLPVFAGLFALAIIAPMLSAGLALLITLLTLTAERRLPKDNAITFEDRLLFLNRISLPWTEKLPEVLIHGLSVGAIPLALIGLVVSLWHMLRWNLSPLTLLGLATASLALGLLTHRRRSPWLLVASLLSGYLTLHATLQAYWLGQSSLAETIAAHLLVASGISLLLWLVAGGNAWWCDQLLMRVAEEREPAIRDRKAFYSGWLQRIAILTNLCVFLLMAAGSFWLLVDSFHGWTAGLALATLMLLAMFFIHVDQVYRNQLGSYLALSSVGLAILWSADQWGSELANGGSWSRTVLYAAASMMAGLLAAILYGWRSAKADEPKVELARSLAVLQFPGRRPIAGWDLWHRPLAVAAICFGLASLLPHVLISGFSPFELANLPVTCVACALSSFGFLFSTRSLRFSTVYVGGIGLAYLAAHCGLQSMFLQGQQGPHLLALHLLLGSLLCAASAVLASLTAAWLNGSRGSRTSAIKVASRFADARDFYCGVLHHVALVFASGLLVCGWILAQTRLDGNSAFGFLLPCSALVVYFAFSGACYRSRIQSYLALAALTLAAWAAAYAWLPMAQVENARELLFAMLALIFGLAAWWIGKPYPSQLPKKAENDDESTSAVNWFENSRLPQCFSRPPLPLVSVDRSIWAIPLTRTSIVLASFATLVIVSGWLKSNVESGSLPLLVSSIALLLATGTFRLGRNASEAGSGEFQAASDVEQALRAGLMLAALTAFACGVYAGVESSVLAEFPRRVAWGWYQVLAVFLVFGLWCVSIVFAAWTRNRLARTPLSEMQRQSALSNAAIYSTLPHALSWLLALSLMVLGTVFAFASSSVMLPSAITLFAAGVTLALMAGSQQSWFSAYAALAALVVAIVMLPMMASGSSLWTLRWSTELLSLLGILGALSALVLTRSYFSRQGEGLSSFPDLARMPHAELSQNWPAIWFPALRDFSLACVALSTSIAGWHFMLGEPALWEPARILGSCFLIAATFFVLPKLYEVAWPTYVGCLALILGTFPAVELIGQPMAILCIAWAVLGLLIWAANLAIERHFRRYVSDSDNSPQFVQWYQRPLLRSSSVVAILAVVVALATATTAAWQTTPLMAALACMLATINLLLCARSANVIHRATLASGLVYLACAVTAICTLVLVSTSWNLSVAALAAAILSLAMVIVGVILVELDRRRSRVSATIDDSRSSADSQHSNWQDVFGQPIAFSGLSLAFVALAISISRSLGANLISDPQTFGLQVDGVWFWHQAVWQRTAASLLLASLTWLVGSRSYVRPIWIHLGVCCGMIGLILFIGSSLTLSPAATGLVALLVANCLIGIARWIHVHPTQAENIALAKPGDTELSFFAWPLAVAMLMLGFQAMHLVNAIQEPQAAGNHLLWLLSTLLTAGFFFQALYQQPKTIWLNMLIAATSVAISLGGIVWGRNLIPADIGLAVLGLAWGGLALRIRHQLLAAGESKPSWIPARLIDSDSHRVMAAWSTGLLLAALTTTFPVAWFLAPAWPSCSLTFLLVATGLAAAAWVFRSTLPIPFAMALLPASIGYATYFYGGMAALVEYAGPMLLSLSIAYGILGQRLTGRSAATDTLVPELGSLLKYGADIGIGLSLAASLVLVTLNAFGLLAALTMLTAAGCWLWRAFESGREAYVYFGFASLMVGILAAAHLIFGLPFGRNALLSLTVVGISFACMGVNILAGRNLESSAGVLARPTYYIALWFPLCLLATIPFDNREITAYCALAGGAFYLFVAHQKQSRWPVYIATILFNVAIYIWMPVLKESTGLFQLYVIPVAISILLIAQLHRQELKHSTLNAIRYAAAGAILATSTLEVFMTEEPSLMRFVVVLMFSLMGTAAGIALRVRPFVFLGLAFMTLNVLGQLGVQFQREGGIIRAVILIAVGILVLAAMIFFNIHRERLLKRYRHFLADSQWE